MSPKRIDRSIDLAVAHDEAYRTWIDFGRFPTFMDALTRVTVVDAEHSIWVVRVVGLDWEYDALITARDPGRMLEWVTTSGEVSLAGRAVFTSVTASTSRLFMRVDWTPRGPVELIGSLLGYDSRIVRRALSHFKARVESGATGSTEKTP